MTEFIQISEISTENRQRKIFDDLSILDLAEGIEQHELLHAPVLLHETSILIAGERRLRAMELLHRKGKEFRYLGDIVPRGCAPVVRASDRDEVALKEAELAENLLRMDLTWQERVSAEKELHELRLKQNPKQTLKDTAREIKREEPTPSDTGRLSEDLVLSRHLEDPEIARIKDRRTAYRKAVQKEQTEQRRKIAEELKISATRGSPHKIYHGDFRQVLQTYDGEKFDLLLTDPPYGVDAGGFNSQFITEHRYADSEEDWPGLMESLAQWSFEVTKDQAHAFVFCDIRKWARLSAFFAQAGWEPWPRPLIWDKGSLGALPKPRHGPRLCYEAILFATKGGKEIIVNGRDVLEFPTPSKERHAAEKPLDLYSELIRRTAKGGSHVLDPFAGSGTIFPAASRMGCYGVGIEIEEEYFNVCLERINE